MTAHPQTRPFISAADYLEQEKAAEIKHEYYNGEIFAMSGGSPWHALLVTNVGAELRAALRDTNCRVFSSDLRVHVEAFKLYTYPDVSVAYGNLELTNEGHSLLNPIVLVGVLSPTTEHYDRGQKFTFYRALPSLREYVLVAQDRKSIEVFRKNKTGHWVLYEPEAGRVELASTGVGLSVEDIYAGVELPDNPPLHPLG